MAQQQDLFAQMPTPKLGAMYESLCAQSAQHYNEGNEDAVERVERKLDRIQSILIERGVI